MAGKFFILSLDGGGLKGLVAIKVLQIVRDLTGKELTETFGLLAGTSSGGLIAAALSVEGHDKKALYHLEHIEEIYLDVIENMMQRGGLSGNEEAQLNQILEKTVGQRKLADSLLPLFVPSYDLSSEKIVIFKTRSAILNESKNIRLFDVCRATSAIPPVFPAYPLRYNKRTLRCVDGGYYLKNPSVAALAEVWKHKHYYSREIKREEDITLLSVSTGNFSGSKPDWSRNIGDVVASQGRATDYIKTEVPDLDLSRIRYMRVDLHLGSGDFSLAQILNWEARLKEFARDERFRDELIPFLQPDN